MQMPGDGWRDAHDYIASTVFDLVSLAGISGTMEPNGIFSMAVPAEVLAAALAEDGSRRSRPGAVPDRSTVIACCKAMERSAARVTIQSMPVMPDESNAEAFAAAG